MPRKATAPQAPVSARRWRYLDETARVLTTVRRPDGSTLEAHPGGVYELHPDHDTDFEHPLLEATDDPAFDPNPVAQTEPPAPTGPDGDTANDPADDERATEES